MPNTSLQRLLLCASVCLAQSASAYLGGFEEQDGYIEGGLNPMRDVSSYNAGQYGTNNGGPGGSPSDIFTNNGLFIKNDIGNIAEGYGELVAHHGLAHSGTSGLVLRSTTSFGDPAPPNADGANYRYSFDNRDFNGITPSTVTGGTVSIDYWMCPQTAFFASGTVTTTEFLNANGDAIFAIGTKGQESFTSKPLIQWYADGVWHDTTIEGNNADWDHVMLSFDLSGDTVSFSYYSSLTLETYLLASNINTSAPLDTLDGIRFTAQPGTEKNSYDDFSITAPMVVPEPGAVLMALIGGMQCLALRRRRRA
jgi:hypothetical protein